MTDKKKVTPMGMVLRCVAAFWLILFAIGMFFVAASALYVLVSP